MEIRRKFPAMCVTLKNVYNADKKHRTFGPVVSYNPLDLLDFTRDRANGPALISKTA